MNEGFGSHLMLDCRQCNYEKIASLEHVWKVLDELPELLGMTKITQPYVFHYNGVEPADKGITGNVIIAESHMTIHTFTEKDYLFCDIFSCVPFDEEKATEYILETFQVRDCEIHQVARGKHFPRGPVKS